MGFNEGRNEMTIEAMAVAYWEEFDSERELCLNDGNILINFSLFACGSGFTFCDEMHLMMFEERL